MQQHHAATPCTYRRISSINASFCLICIDLTPCEREKLCISIVFKHLTYAYRANFSRTANKLIEAQLSGSQQRASHGAMPRTASRKRRNKGAGQEALGLEPRDRTRGVRAGEPSGRTRGVRATAVSSPKEPDPKECQDPRAPDPGTATMSTPRAPDPRAATVPTPRAGALLPPRCRLRERGPLLSPQRRIRGARPPQRRIRGGRGRRCHRSDGSEGPGCRAHTTSDAEQTDAVAARISSHPVARRA